MYPLDNTIYRNAVCMDIKDIQKNTDAGKVGFFPLKLFRRKGFFNLGNDSICRADDQTISKRRDAPWIAKKINAPPGEEKPKETQKIGKKKENESYACE